MRTGVWPLGLVVGLSLGGIASSLAIAGPGSGGKRVSFSQTDEPRDRVGKTEQIVRETRALLAPLVGEAREPSVQLVSDRTRFDELAASAGESDATVFADVERHALVALDLEV